MAKEKNWCPIEGNPKTLKEYLVKLQGPNDIYFCDVMALEDWAFDFIPQPLLGFIVLYPITKKSESHRKEQADALVDQSIPQAAQFIKQTIGNACGTIAMLHMLLNLPDNYKENFGGSIKEFCSKCQNKTDEERAKILENDEAIEKAHSYADRQGETSTIEADADVDTHFIYLTYVDENLIEFDGRKKCPVNHGKFDNAQEGYLEVSKKFSNFADEENDIRFSVIAVVGSPPVEMD